MPRNLQQTRRSSQYTAVLSLAYSLLVSFSISHSSPHPRTLVDQPAAANDLLIEFIQELYDLQKPLYIARHAILAVQHYHRTLKGLLRPAWDSIESWTFELEATSRPPMPVIVLFAFVALCRLRAIQAAKDGQPLLGYQLFVLSILAESAYFGLLRPYEMLALSRILIYLPYHSGGNRWPIAAIERPKAWRAMGKRQFATLRLASFT
jgi:hypothetical protein